MTPINGKADYRLISSAGLPVGWVRLYAEELIGLREASLPSQ